MSKIEWTGKTWNPVTGCTKISAGCKHCYAETMALRLQRMGQAKYHSGFEVVTHPDVLDTPLRTRKPTTWFVNSMSDLFHEQISEDYIRSIFDVMVRAYWHTFQILTKRSGRLRTMAPQFDWSEHIWMGVTVESNEYTWRADDLRCTPAAVKFLSLEPLLGPLPSLDLDGIDWVIVGGESGPCARPMREDWVLSVRDRCQVLQTPFFFKQWGGVNKKRAGRTLQGRFWEEMPLTSNRRIQGSP